MLGPRFARWRVNLTPPCYAPDAAGFLPELLQPRSTRRTGPCTGKLPKSWWDNTSCKKSRNSSGPISAAASDVSFSRLENRAALLSQIDGLSRTLESDRAIRNMTEYQRQALQLVLSQRGKNNPFDLSQESDKTQRPLWPRRMGTGIPGREAARGSGCANGAGQLARLGHASKRLPRSEREAAPLDRPLPERFPRRPR